jgi:hypothetical protein
VRGNLPTHKDIVGRAISIGDVVAVAQKQKTVDIGVVLKIHPKMITVTVLHNSNTRIHPHGVLPNSNSRLYPHGVLVVDSTDHITMFVLKNS